MRASPARWALPLLLLVPAAMPARALDPARPAWRYVQEVWDLDDGLPQNSVNALAQTPDGYLWVGTYDGLARFDGYRFEVLRPGTHPGLASGTIRTLQVDGEGRLWAGTGGGLSVLDGDGCRLVAGTEGWLVRALAADAADNLWIGSVGHGLARLDRNGALTAVAVAPGVSSVTALHSDAAGRLWIGSEGAGLWRRDASGAVTRIEGPPTDTLILTLFGDGSGGLWVVTNSGGLWRVEGDRATVVGAGDPLFARVWALARDGAGSLWLGTAGSGLIRRRGDTVDRHWTGTGLPDDVVSAILEDHEGALWVGTAASGLVRLQGGSLASLGAADGVPASTVYSVVQDAHGEMWVATVAGVLAHGRVAPFEVEAMPGVPPRTPLRSLAVGPGGELWVATYGLGVLRRDREGTWRRFTQADGLASDSVRAIVATRSGEVWAGTIRGLARYAGGKWTTLGVDQGLPSASLVSLAEGRDGSIWFGLDGGGLGRRLPDGRLELLTQRDGLASDVVLSLRPGSDGDTLWIGTNGGLSRLRRGRLTTWTTRHGLPSDNVVQVAEDGAGSLWLGTTAGVARIPLAALGESAADLPVRVFGRADGMTSGQATGPSNGPLVDSAGRLWFPTVDGLATLDPRRLVRDEVPPIVHVEQVVADGRAQTRRGGTVELPHGIARLAIHYTGICTRAAHLVRFRYRLVGFDPAWVEAGSSRVAQYTRVPPGRYRFEVVAVNADGATASGQLAVVMPHRFWETAAFRYGSIVVVLLLAFAGVRARLAGLRARQLALERTVALRTDELHQANLALAETNRQLAELSLQDALTGLANRRRFDQALDEEWRRARRGGGWLSLVLLDVDAFKQYNDALGHPAGDACLQRLARLLARRAARAGEITARWGGEEFALLLPGCSPEDTGRLAEALRRDVMALGEPHPASAVAPVLTVSLGIASLRPETGGEPGDLVELADAALYRAKQGGRNRVESAAPTQPAAEPH
jgi:diguanylate cyclase (GGDEF)-like protein